VIDTSKFSVDEAVDMIQWAADRVGS